MAAAIEERTSADPPRSPWVDDRFADRTAGRLPRSRIPEQYPPTAALMEWAIGRARKPVTGIHEYVRRHRRPSPRPRRVARRALTATFRIGQPRVARCFSRTNRFSGIIVKEKSSRTGSAGSVFVSSNDAQSIAITVLISTMAS